MKDLNEMIADAKAEEQVQREQEQREDKFRKDLKAKLAELVDDTRVSKVELDLNEYVKLKLKENDLDRLIGAIVSGLRLSYDKESLRLDGDKVVNAIETLYPEAYDDLLEAIKAEEGE